MHIGALMVVGVLSALLADYFITPILVNWLKPFEKEQEWVEEPGWAGRRSETLPVADTLYKLSSFSRKEREETRRKKKVELPQKHSGTKN